MKLITDTISRDELKQMANHSFGDLVKAVVDIEKMTMVVDAGLHADEEAYLLSQGSKQENLWGINLYPDSYETDFVEFDSMINLRPNQNNRTRSVDDENIRKRIIDIVNQLVR